MATDKKSSKPKTFFKRYGIIVWICAAILILGSVGVIAAYTNQSTVKRVISTQKDSGIAFSSNYLLATERGNNADDYSLKIWTTIKDPEGSDTLETLYAIVCNYPQSDPSQVNTDNITYTFSAYLVDKSGNAIKNGVALTDKLTLDSSDFGIAFGGITYSFVDNDKIGGAYAELPAQTMTAAKNGVTHSYVVTFDIKYMDYVDMVVVAEPDASSYNATGEYKLARRFSFGEASANQPKWEGEFTDDYNARTPGEYDGFNYKISGSGEGRFTLSWNTAYVEISPWFIEELEAETAVNSKFDEETGIKTISFSVGEADERAEYILQFYRKDNPAGETYEAYSDGDKTFYTLMADGLPYVTYTFTTE